MNKAQRTRIEQIADKIQEYSEELREMADEEQEKAENVAENFPNSEQLEGIENAAAELAEAADTARCLSSDLHGIISE